MLVAVCSFASWRPLPENSYQPKIDPDQVIYHSAVDAPGRTSLFGYFSRDDVTVESTFYIYLDGAIEQYVDTTVRADANRYSNNRAVSVETEDDGNPNERRWTPQQIQSIKRLQAWLWSVHPKIQKRMCPAWNESGVGYHTMWGAPSPWTPAVGKTCPGVIRKLQWAQEIAPWIKAVAQTVNAPNNPDVKPLDEDEDMWIHSSKWTGQTLIDGDTATWIDSSEEVNSLLRQGVRAITFIDESTAKRVLSERTNVRDDLQRIELRLAAIQTKVVNG